MLSGENFDSGRGISNGVSVGLQCSIVVGFSGDADSILKKARSAIVPPHVPKKLTLSVFTRFPKY